MNVAVAAILYWLLVDTGKQLVVCQTSDDLARLQWDLLHNYNTSIQPVRNLSDVTMVTIDIFFLQVEHLDMKTQTLKSNGWFKINWQDQFLTWNPDNYGGINSFVVLQNRVWIPDIVPINIVNGKRQFASVDFLVNINSNGTIIWNPDFNMDTTCPVDIRYFPFDTQSCEIQVCSWEHTRDVLYLRSKNKMADLSWRLMNGEFKIEAAYTKITDEWMVDVMVFSLKLERRFRYYLLALILPVCLMSVMCIISFLVPVKSGEKMAMSMTTLLSFTVYLGVIDTAMPKTSEHISLLLMYISGLLTVSMLSVVGNAVVLYIHYRSGKENVAGINTAKNGKEKASRDEDSKHGRGFEDNVFDVDKLSLPHNRISPGFFNFTYLKLKVSQLMSRRVQLLSFTGPQLARFANKAFFFVILFICASLVLLFSIMVNI